MKKNLLPALLLVISKNILAFGAGAFDGDRAATVSGNFETLAEAQKAALDTCGSGCKIFLNEFKNSCTVIVEGESGLSYATNQEQVDAATTLAIQQCQSQGNKNCVPALAVCDLTGKPRSVRTVGNVKPVQNNNNSQNTKPSNNYSENPALKSPETKNLPYIRPAEPTIFYAEEVYQKEILRRYKSEKLIYPDGVSCQSFRHRSILSDGRPEISRYNCYCQGPGVGEVSSDAYSAKIHDEQKRDICATLDQFNLTKSKQIESEQKKEQAKKKIMAEMEARRRVLKLVCKGRPKINHELYETMSRQIGVHPNSITLENVFVDETVFGPNCLATFYTSKGAFKKVVYFDGKGVINRYDDGSGTFLNFIMKQ
jgi:hypothetical protein